MNSMHELSIALSIIEIATEELQRRGGRGVKTVYLQLGPLAGVVPEALTSAFELAREETPLANSRLVYEAVPLRVFCQTCQREQTLSGDQDLRCPACETPCGEIISGRELEIAAMEIEQ